MMARKGTKMSLTPFFWLVQSASSRWFIYPLSDSGCCGSNLWMVQSVIGWFNQGTDCSFVEWFSNGSLIVHSLTQRFILLIIGPSYEQLSLLVDCLFNCMVHSEIGGSSVECFSELVNGSFTHSVVQLVLDPTCEWFSLVYVFCWVVKSSCWWFIYWMVQ